jgi:hypothetical protein
MEILEAIIGLVTPFAVIWYLWKGAKEDWKKA